MRFTGLFLCCTILVACSSGTQQSGRYSQKHDSAPLRLPTAAELEDPIPRQEPPSRGGNKRYTVWGKTYQPMKSAEGYSQVGDASWYGRKFHGHLTSNGETYDMFAMSAAHKTLPLPTYLKVTNLSNGKTVIVRVNDRGPFHGERIIDLSYSAAYKLDMLKSGTARVKIETYSETPPPKPVVQVATTAPNKVQPIKQPLPNLLPATNSDTEYHIQVLVTRDKDKADSTGLGLSIMLDVDKSVQQSDDLYKLRLGPFKTELIAREVLEEVKASGYQSAYLVSLSQSSE